MTENYYNQILEKEFKEKSKSALLMIKSVINGQILPLLELYQNKYNINFNEKVLNEIKQFLKKDKK